MLFPLLQFTLKIFVKFGMIFFTSLLLKCTTFFSKFSFNSRKFYSVLLAHEISQEKKIVQRPSLRASLRHSLQYFRTAPFYNKPIQKVSLFCPEHFVKSSFIPVFNPSNAAEKILILSCDTECCNRISEKEYTLSKPTRKMAKLPILHKCEFCQK